MKTIHAPTLALLAGALFFAPSAVGQRDFDQDEMKANFAEMQTHEWFTAGEWLLDFDAAKQRAKEIGKPIFTYFTRAYAP
ncbi:MAG: hypothetical protein AAF196_00790 [Planctomycetota bacterium]